MTLKKDMRRPELVVAYVEPDTKESEGDMTSTIASTLPMAAMFTRNKLIGWTALIFAIQNWLSETPATASEKSQPGWFSVGMSLMSVFIAYMPLFLPPPGRQGGTGTEAPAAAPLS